MTENIFRQKLNSSCEQVVRHICEEKRPGSEDTIFLFVINVSMSATFSNTLKSQKSQLHQWKPKVSTLVLKLFLISALMATNGKESFDVTTLHICYYIFFVMFCRGNAQQIC